MRPVLQEALAATVRGLVDAQVALDQRAADDSRWDDEGLPPVALSYGLSRFTVAAPLLVRTRGGGAVVPGVHALLPQRGEPGTRLATLRLGVRLHTHSQPYAGAGDA